MHLILLWPAVKMFVSNHKHAKIARGTTFAACWLMSWCVSVCVCGHEHISGSYKTVKMAFLTLKSLVAASLVASRVLMRSTTTRKHIRQSTLLWAESRSYIHTHKVGVFTVTRNIIQPSSTTSTSSCVVDSAVLVVNNQYSTWSILTQYTKCFANAAASNAKRPSRQSQLRWRHQTAELA